MSARIWGLALTLGLASIGCKSEAESTPTRMPFTDNFDRAELGPDWFPSGGHWTISNGTVYTTGANNAPLFLKAKLPNDLVMEVDIKSETKAVDAKIELMTDGRTHQSGYIFILGGWDNKLSVIARLDEHGEDRKAMQPTRAVGGKSYRWRIEKKGGSIKWFIDGKLYMTYEDKEPLQGAGHDRVAFSNWQNELRYDNLKIWAHDKAPPVSTSSTAR